MSQPPLHKCAHSGCRAMVRGQARCPAHTKQQSKEQDKRRGTAQERGYTYRWQQYSKAFLSRPENALCKECEKRGRIVASECTDHIVPHNGSEELFWNPENHQGLCIKCNSAKGSRAVKC